VKLKKLRLGHIIGVGCFVAWAITKDLRWFIWAWGWVTFGPELNF